MIVGLAVSVAQGAVCCGSGPPVDPSSLGPSEHAGVAVGLGGTLAPSRWGADGRLHPASGGEVGATLAGRLRVAPGVQVGAVLPAVARASEGAFGGGVGEAALVGRIERPLREQGPLRPVLVAALIAPPQIGSDDRVPWWRVLIGPSLERQGERTQTTLWSAVSAPVLTPRPGDLRPGVGWELGASAGLRGAAGAWWVGLGAGGTTAGWVGGRMAGVGSVSPLARFGATLPLGESSRLVAVATGMAPIPGIGRNATLSLGGSAAVMRTW